MPICLEKANIRTFADDTTVFYSSNSLQDLEKTINEEFNHVLNYCSADKLSVYAAYYLAIIEKVVHPTSNF